MRKNNWLVDFRRKETAQCGEDGILEKIFEVINQDHGWCVDVGAQGQHNSNTNYLFSVRDWPGVVIEMNGKFMRSLRNLYKNKKDVYCIHEMVTPSGPKSLDHLLKSTPIPNEFLLLSIDIDGNDYYVWQSLENYVPLVVLIEFNPVMAKTDYLQDIDGKGGASLSFLIKLGKSKGYELVATTEFNAFFVKKELFDKFEIEDNSIDELFIENNNAGYGRNK